MVGAAAVKRWILALVALAIMVAASAPVATAKAPTKAGGQLDPSFGNAGKVIAAYPAGFTGSNGPQYTLPFEFTPGHLEMAQAPGGKLVVAGATKIVRYLANGKLDNSFGRAGTVTVPPPPGGAFVLAAVAVDPAGRIVLAGLARQVPPNSTPDPVQSSAAVMRFNSDGTPDSSFGNGGMLITNFGLSAPKAAGGRYPSASVGLADVAIYPQNRIVLSGGVVTELSSCSSSVNSEGFVVGLTETGAVDPTFGFHLVEGLASVGQITPRSRGYLALASGGPLCQGTEGPASVMIGIDPSGNLDSGFASFGFRTLPFSTAPALTVAPSGKILLLGRPQIGHTYKQDKEGKRKRVSFRYQVIQRLLPSGAGDPGLSRTGKVSYRDPESGSLSAIAVDAQERIYVAGRIGERISKSPHKKLLRKTFLLTRLTPAGNEDRSFGRGGSVNTGFGGPTDSFATQVMLDAKGRILVGGGLSAPQFASGGGFAIARYLSGP